MNENSFTLHTTCYTLHYTYTTYIYILQYQEIKCLGAIIHMEKTSVNTDYNYNCSNGRAHNFDDWIGGA